ncbi:hypothetical protein CASFOL_021960 [Castilleja foliolosa]|uniref:Uncharacterized protein n=1 Tax=Castilleja foliolosa TaxID=1961234 RepID=A0ABD3D052_9LAMI
MGESFVSAGPAVYISSYGPNDIMLQPFPPQTSHLFGGSPGVTQNHVPVGNVTRNVNIHNHSGASLANLVPVNVIGNRAPNVEETRGQRVNEAPDLSSVSTSVPQIDAQLRNLAANMQSGNHASSGGVSNQEQPAGGGIRDDETTQTSGNIDIADAMSQALGGSSLDGELARLSQQTGVGSPDMLRNILQQFTQDPAMRNTMNQMAQRIDAQHFESVFSGVESHGGDFGLTRMIQQMMPIVSQALGSMSQQNPPRGEGLLENSSRRGVASTYDNTQINLRQVTRIEHQAISQNILRYVIDRGVQLSRGDESLGSALCISVLAQEFMDMLLLGLSGRLEDGM